MADLDHLRYGRIVWARVTDPNGNRKERPCVVMTPNACIGRDQPLLVVAITTTFSDPPPKWHVELPWHPDPRRVGTGLARRSAAVVNWLDMIRVDDVLDVKGSVAPAVMRRIEALQEEWAREVRSED